jgi:hypothetical protein
VPFVSDKKRRKYLNTVRKDIKRDIKKSWTIYRKKVKAFALLNKRVNALIKYII